MGKFKDILLTILNYCHYSHNLQSQKKENTTNILWPQCIELWESEYNLIFLKISLSSAFLLGVCVPPTKKKKKKKKITIQGLVFTFCVFWDTLSFLLSYLEEALDTSIWINFLWKCYICIGQCEFMRIIWRSEIINSLIIIRCFLFLSHSFI